MTDHQLDAVYTRLCRTMTRLGEAATPLFLARFALLAIDRIGDEATVIGLVDAAAADLAPASAGTATGAAERSSSSPSTDPP